MTTLICTRSNHPTRNHWHYGPGGRSWCTDRYSALLQQGDCDGKVYVKVDPYSRSADA